MIYILKYYGTILIFCVECKNIFDHLLIDNYFDTINHEILFKRVFPLIPDDEVFRLVQLCIKMGMINKQREWEQIEQGVPQGAILSPLLANFYLHSFDQFVLSRTKMYVRYADDFIILCKTLEEAEKLLAECSTFLQDRLKLRLNEPVISKTQEGIEFLGVLINNQNISISQEKKEKLKDKILLLQWEKTRFSQEGLDALSGIKNYYANLLPQNILNELDEILYSHLKQLIQTKWQEIPNKTTLERELKSILFSPKKTLSRIES